MFPFAVQGRLACCGSPMFLKHNYGVGYQLTFVKASVSGTRGVCVSVCMHVCVSVRASVRMRAATVLTTPDVSLSFPRSWLCQSGTDVDAVTAVVKTIPGADLLSNVGTELSFRLPMHESARFAPMLAQVSSVGILWAHTHTHAHMKRAVLSAHSHTPRVPCVRRPSQIDENLERYGVLSYGISVTTMEEVFLRVASEASAEVSCGLPSPAPHTHRTTCYRSLLLLLLLLLLCVCVCVRTVRSVPPVEAEAPSRPSSSGSSKVHVKPKAVRERGPQVTADVETGGNPPTVADLMKHARHEGQAKVCLL